MQRQIVVLEVFTDEDAPPAEWDWTELVGDPVTVLAGGPIEVVSPIEAEIRRRL